MKDFVCVRDFVERFDAERAKSIVDAAEIVAVLVHDDAGGWGGGPLPLRGPFQRAQLLVARKDAPRADRMLEDQGL